MSRRFQGLIVAVGVIFVAADDHGGLPIRLPGGAVFGATVVDQIDPTTLRVDLGPAKGDTPGGVILVRAVSRTRFMISAGIRGSTYTGSLGAAHLGAGIPVTVMLDTRARSDGSYTLLELMTNTR
jgi:hypothetical protein